MNTSVNSSFSRLTPMLQLAWDSTSLGQLKTCARKYQLSIILGKTTQEQNVHLTFGILYHRAQELFHRKLFEKVAFDDAVSQTIRFLLKATWNDKLKRPWNSGDPNKNRYTLVRTFVWWTEQYKDDSAQTIIMAGKPAVELSFSYQSSIRSKDDEPYLLCGHLDRVVTLSGLEFIKDYKSTKYDVRSTDYFDFYSPDNQMSMYNFAGRVIYRLPVQGVIVDAAQVLVNSSRFRRGFAHRTEAQATEWYRELTEFWIPQAEDYARRNVWPMNDTACGRYGGCEFRGICGKDPVVREEWLRHFKERTWDPLKVRGDV